MDKAAGLKRRSRVTGQESRRITGVKRRSIFAVFPRYGTTCYGCKGRRVRNRPSDAAPPPPHDVFNWHRERRLYNQPRETKIWISSSPGMVYYHLLKSCTNLTAGDVREGKVIVSDDVQKNLRSLHKSVLFKEFGMTLNQ